MTTLTRFVIALLAGLGIAILSTAPAQAAARPRCFFGAVPQGVIHPSCGGGLPAQAPAVIADPHSQSVVDGSPATFVANASGSPAPNPTWESSTDGGTTWSPVSPGEVTHPGVTSTQSTWSFPVSLADNGELLHAVFQNVSGTATTASATLTVVPLAPAVGLSASALNFGKVPVGGTTTTPLTITNTGNDTLSLYSVSNLAGIPFGIGADGCSTHALAPGEQCVVDVAFSPESAAAFTDTVSVLSNAGLGTDLVPVTGIGGTAPTITSVSAPQAEAGGRYHGSIVTSGYPKPVVKVVSGAVPAGLRLSRAGNLSGVPTTAGTYRFKVRAGNGLAPAAHKWVSVTVLDLPTISVADVSIRERSDSALHPLRFTVTLSRPSGYAVRAFWVSLDGTAMAGSDYSFAEGWVKFAKGATTAHINVLEVGDTTPEPDETLTVLLSAPEHATLDRATATGTITNDD